MRKTKKRKLQLIPGVKSGRCPYCGSTVILRSAEGIYRDNPNDTMLYVCSKYPECDTYIRVQPGTKRAMGSLANGGLRALRREAHQYFDRLHLSGVMSRKEAYEWLAGVLQSPMSQTHIGYLGEYYCRQVIAESRKLMENRQRAQMRKSVCPFRQAVGGEFYATD